MWYLFSIYPYHHVPYYSGYFLSLNRGQFVTVTQKNNNNNKHNSQLCLQYFYKHNDS